MEWKPDGDFQRAVELVKGLGRGFRVLNFSHNDVDGVCSAFLIKRTFERFFGSEVLSVMPPTFMLTADEVREVVKERGEFDLLVISDKGTFKSYDEMTEMVGSVLVIDHHQPQGYPAVCTVLNPGAGRREYMPATALTCYMLMRMLGESDDVDDIVAAVGCRGDFAFDTVEGFCHRVAEPFLRMIGEKYPCLIEPVEGEPTIFDRSGRKKTALLNQMVEAIHAGTLAHLYRDELGEEIEYGPDLVLKFFGEAGAGKLPPESLEEFLSGRSGRLIRSVHLEFKKDCVRLEKRVKDPIFLGRIGKTDVLLVFAREVRRAARTTFSAILPFVAFAHMAELGRPDKALIVFCPKDVGTQISMKTDGEDINCGDFLSELARRLAERYPGKRVSGGGHARSAGFFAWTPIPVYAVLHEMIFLLEEMLTEPAV
jgi:hypothetical protein